MWLANYTRILITDYKSSLFKLLFIFITLSIGVMTLTTMGLKEPETIPDVFNMLFTKSSFYALTIPLYLFFLSFVLLPTLSPLRVLRYSSRTSQFFAIFFTIFSSVVIYLCFYFFIGFIWGWHKSGELENTWATEYGRPFIASDGKIDLALFQTHYMIIRYTLTQLFAYMAVGLFASILFYYFQKYIVVFFIVEGFILFDLVIEYIFHFSFFYGKAVVALNNWGTIDYFVGIIIYFVGILLFFSVCLYLVITKKEYLSAQEEME